MRHYIGRISGELSDVAEVSERACALLTMRGVRRRLHLIYAKEDNRLMIRGEDSRSPGRERKAYGVHDVFTAREALLSSRYLAVNPWVAQELAEAVVADEQVNVMIL